MSQKKHQFSLVACARWEETEIAEWIEYHRSIGFDHIYLYSNDDDPTAFFEVVAPYAIGDNPFVSLFHWPKVGDQIGIYLHFIHKYKRETEWFSFLDIDEFFVIKYLNNISLFMEHYKGTVDCLYFNWVIYGNSGKLKRDNSPTLTTYCLRAAGADHHTKMLCRSDAIDVEFFAAGLRAGKGAFWHFLDNYELPDVKCRDILLLPTDGYSANFPESADAFVKRDGFSTAILERAYVAHFQFKSEEDFLRRWRRGGFDNGNAWRGAYESGEYMSILAKTNEVSDTYLSNYSKRHGLATAKSTQRPGVLPQTRRNLALNMPSRQSSVYVPVVPEPPGSELMGFANNGVKTGLYGFHTTNEENPWWSVDLLVPCDISEIHIYNRRDSPALAARASGLVVLASADNRVWRPIYTHNEREIFGIHGEALVVRTDSAASFRFLKIELRKAEYLHLDEVEVYGRFSAQS